MLHFFCCLIARFLSDGIVSVAANATDNISVTRVEYYVNGSVQPTAVTGMFQEQRIGHTRSKARAYGAAQNAASHQITVTSQ
jgi:hypothetical protein